MHSVTAGADSPRLRQLAQTLKALGHPDRLRILQVLGTREECVCHVSAALGLRQAAVSQHLGTLRQAGIVSSRRDGLNIFYRITSSEVPSILEILDLPIDTSSGSPVANCLCPRCLNRGGETGGARACAAASDSVDSSLGH